MISNLFNNRFIADGGPVQFVLLGLSVIMIATIIDHLLFSLCLNRRLQGNGFPLLNRLFEKRLTSILDAITIPENEENTKRATGLIFRNISLLSLISTISPILGVLGTVHGIIVTFWNITGKKNLQFTDISLGISHALYTTAFGLVICLTAMVAVWVGEKRVNRFLPLGQKYDSGHKASTR